MEISTYVTVGSGNFLYDEAGAAAQVLAALGGSPADDVSTADIRDVTLRFEVVVTLGDGDAFQYTPDGAAQQVLAALGGNPTTDTCVVSVSMPGLTGTAGVPSSLTKEAA